VRYGRSGVNLFLVCVILSGCVSGRTVHEFSRLDGAKVRCFEPPPDVVLKKGDAKISAAVKEIGDIVKADASTELSTERIREISKEVNDYEVIEFRMCTQYGNNALGPVEYQRFLTEVLPVLRSSTKSQLKSDTELRFEADLKEVKFIRHRRTKMVRAEFQWWLRPVVLDNQKAAHIFIGRATLYNDEVLDPTVLQEMEMGKCHGVKSCLGNKVWYQLVENPIIIRGGTGGSYVTWTPLIPGDVKVVRLDWDFYQRESDNNTYCREVVTEYQIEGIGMLETAEVSGERAKWPCYRSYDSRVFYVPS
jgi:hypothetical protein